MKHVHMIGGHARIRLCVLLLLTCGLVGCDVDEPPLNVIGPSVPGEYPLTKQLIGYWVLELPDTGNPAELHRYPLRIQPWDEHTALLQLATYEWPFNQFKVWGFRSNGSDFAVIGLLSIPEIGHDVLDTDPAFSASEHADVRAFAERAHVSSAVFVMRVQFNGGICTLASVGTSDTSKSWKDFSEMQADRAIASSPRAFRDWLDANPDAIGVAPFGETHVMRRVTLEEFTDLLKEEDEEKQPGT